MMKAIFTGSLKDGFCLEAIVPDEQAENLVVANMANGLLCEAIDVQDPATAERPFRAEPEGKAYVVFGSGLGNGFEVFGPFDQDGDSLNDFAEANRGDDCEWEQFDLVG